MKRVYIIILAVTVSLIHAKVTSHWDGGRNPPVHRLALQDEFGDSIIPGDKDALPISTKNSCGQCHDYETIAGGWHSNMSTLENPGRPAQPWFLIDAVSGSQIPMSLREWTGTCKPDALGMTNWEWVMEFGRHLPGGDIADPEDIYVEGGERARWHVSGPVELNCFACHSHSKSYDHSEWVKLILRENFRWAATGALGIGEILGMGSRVADYWGILRGTNPDDSVFAVPPHIKYDDRLFDSKNRTILELGKPRNQNCLNCHSTTEKGMENCEIDGDVHLRANMNCTDCHSSGLDHAIARGYEGDETGKPGYQRTTASCTGCHLGDDQVQPGRYGAPLPQHTGIPINHFKDLTCTACHSGVTREGKVAEVRTSRANRMGVYGRARWATPQPFIQEPVFMRNNKGQIEPRRIAWPAFWGTRSTADETEIIPIHPDKIISQYADLLNIRGEAGYILAILGSDANAPGTPTLALDGVLFEVNIDGIALPVEGKSEKNGWYYKTATNLVQLLPDYAHDADLEKMNDEQLTARYNAETRLSEILQTIDAAPLAITNGYGAAIYGNTLFFRGGAEDSMISTNANVTMAEPTLGWYLDGVFTPLISNYVSQNLQELGSSECTLTESMVSAVLERMQKKEIKNPVYVAHGQVWQLTAQGELATEKDPAAEPVTWAVAHDVRPARLARGAAPRKCSDCHTPNSDFFFTQVVSTGPLLTSRTLLQAQHTFMQLSGSYNRVFGTTFLMRPVFKIFLWIVFALVALVGVAFVSAAIPALLAQGGIPYGRPLEKLLTQVDFATALAMMAAAGYLGLSGLAGWFFGMMTGYVLIFHMVAGGLYAVALLLLIWLRGGNRIANQRRNGLWAAVLILGAAVVFSAVLPMMTLLNTNWQVIMLWTHRLTSMAFLAVAAWMLLSSGRKE